MESNDLSHLVNSQNCRKSVQLFALWEPNESSTGNDKRKLQGINAWAFRELENCSTHVDGWNSLFCSFGSSLITFYDKQALKDLKILACELKKEILAKESNFLTVYCFYDHRLK